MRVIRGGPIFIRQNTLTNFDQRRGVGVLIVVIYKVRKEVFFLLRGGGLKQIYNFERVW